MKHIVTRSASSPQSIGIAWRPGLVRLLLLAHYAVFGLIIGVQGIGWNDVKLRIGLSDSLFGLAFMVTPLVAFGLLLYGRTLWRMVRCRTRAVAGLIVIAGSLAFLASAADLGALVVSRLLAGLGFSLLDGAVHDATLDWEAASGGRLLSFLYAAFSSGAILGALVAGSLLQSGYSASAVLTSLIPMCLIGAMLTALCAYPPMRKPVVTIAAAPSDVSLRGWPFLRLAALCLAGVCAEVIVGLWSSIDMRARGGDALASSIAFALFNAGLIGGRLLHAAIIDRLGARAALRWSCLGLGSAAGLLAGNSIAFSLAAYTLAGLGVAGVMPTVLSSVRHLPGANDSVTARLIAMGYLGALVAPALAGGLAEAFGPRMALPVALGAIAIILKALSSAVVSQGKPTTL